MTRWLQSGRRRDLCALLYRLTDEGIEGVESHYAWLTARLDGRAEDDEG
ncbi:MAG: hypothetical protein ABEK02_01205 [Haloquadratum sp.]